MLFSSFKVLCFFLRYFVLGIVRLFGNSCAFLPVLSFVFCATLCSELCDFSEILVFFSSLKVLWFLLVLLLLFGSSCVFFLILSFVLFLVLLCARNCVTFRKFLCFFSNF